MLTENHPDSLKQAAKKEAERVEDQVSKNEEKNRQNQTKRLLGKSENKLYRLSDAAKNKISEINK